MEERHQTFSNLVLKGKLREAVRFFCEIEKRVVLQLDKLAADHTGTIKKTIVLVLEGKHPSKTIPSCATLETYEEAHIFIPVDIMEEDVESVAQKLSGSFGPRGTDSEALQGRLLKFGEDGTRLRTSVKTFVDWLSNGGLPWASYRAFMSGRLITLDKHPGVLPVGGGEMWRRLFANIVLKFTGPESTMGCQDDQLCAGLEA